MQGQTNGRDAQGTVWWRGVQRTQVGCTSLPSLFINPDAPGTLLFLGVYVGSHWVGPGNKIITHTVELSLRDQRMRAESSNSLLVRLLLLVTSPPS